MAATVFYENAAEFATLTNTFTVSGVATDPTTISLTVTTPAGVATTYTHAGGTITKSATGIYTKDIACTEDGVWLYLWVGTGTASDAVAGTWTVQPVDTNTLYCTPEELKSRAGIPDTNDDFEILAVCHAVSRWIDDHCGPDRHFYRRTATMTFDSCDPYKLTIPDLVSVTTLKTDPDGDGTFEQTWATTDYQLQPVNAAAHLEAEPYTKIKAIGGLTFPVLYGTGYNTRTDRTQLVGVYGWPAVPRKVKMAAAIMCADFLKLGEMAFGVQGYGDYGAIRARVSTPVLSMLERFQRYPQLVA